MNMINVRRLTVMTFLGAGMLSGISAQVSPLKVDTLKETKIPAQWDLQSCIDYAKEQNITIRKNRITAASTQIDVKTAKAALFPSLSFSTSQQVVNRPYQETSSRVSGSEIISSNSKTSYNGNYGLNASWTLYNGNKRLKTIQQEKLNNQVAELDVATSENNIQESIAQVYIQILYAAESVKVNESTLQVSIAQRDRGQELLNAGSIAKSDFAQLEAQLDGRLLLEGIHAVWSALSEDAIRNGLSLTQWNEYASELLNGWNSHQPEMLHQRCLRVFDHYQEQAMRQRHDHRMELLHQVEDYILEHLREDLTCACVAEQFHYHPNYLSRILKAGSGKTLNDLIVEVRMNQACRLLEQGYRVSDAAVMVGCDNFSHFSRLFRKVHGESPSQYRQRCGGSTKV